jgi:hypothetical protein
LRIEDLNLPKSAVGLFEHPGMVDKGVSEIDALGFPRIEVRSRGEPLSATGVVVFPGLDFEADLVAELTRNGATQEEAQVYAEGLRRGDALVVATGSDGIVEAAAEVMKRSGAVEIEQANAVQESMAPVSDPHVMAARVRKAGGSFGR